MYLYSVQGLKADLESTQYYKERVRITDKHLIIDKANFVINSIISINNQTWKPKSNPVSLHRDILYSQLGKKYYQIVELLKDLNYINVGIKYKVGSKNVQGQSKQYNLTDEALSKGIIKAGILCKRTERKIRKAKEQKLKSYLKHPIHKKILYSITDLKFNPKETAEELYKKHHKKEDTEEAKLHWIDSYNLIKELSNNDNHSYKIGIDSFINSNFHYSAHNNAGRVFHTYNNIPKTYRKLLSTKSDKKLFEVDMTNSQPLLIAIVLKSSIDKALGGKETHNNNIKVNSNKYIKINKIKGIKRDIDSYCVSLCLKDNNNKASQSINLFYNDMIQGTFYSECINTGKELGLFKEMSRDDIKVKMLEAFYYPIFSSNNKLTIGQKILSHRYTLVFKLLQYIKTELNKLAYHYENIHNIGHKYFAQYIQSIESNIFINEFYSEVPEGYFAIPLHDAILCTEDNKEDVKNRLVDAYKNVLPMIDKDIIHNLLKVKINELG